MQKQLPNLKTDDALSPRAQTLRAEFEALVPSAIRKESIPEEQADEILQLPLWSDNCRGVPNSVLRSALFPAIQGRDRKHLNNVRLNTQQGIEIHFTGLQLNQSDLDVWEHALHLARCHPLGTKCRFSARSFLKQIHRSVGYHDHKWLKETLQRLAAALVNITHGDLVYFGTLIQGGFWHKGHNYYWLELNPNIVKLYTAGYWTTINWEQRQQLRRKPLALWLHGYYASHYNPYSLKVETIRNLSGSSTQQLRAFKQKLTTALDVLQETGAITEWHITNNLVHVKTPPRLKHAATAQTLPLFLKS